jgi:uncharacterized protein
MTIAVIDTNLLLSALINPAGLPRRVFLAWVDHSRYTLATCAFQIAELRDVTRRPSVARYFRPAQAGRMINQLQALALIAPEPLPRVDASPDPYDNFLLGCAMATNAHYVVSGDKSDVLALGRHGSTRIVTMRAFADVIACN